MAPIRNLAVAALAASLLFSVPAAADVIADAGLKVRPIEDVFADGPPRIEDLTGRDGVLRFVSSVPLACSVVYGETEAFGPLLKQIQQELGATMVVIEHDMPMIMALSDRVYCLEAGQVIAEGLPDEVRNDPMVVASYLGTDQRAIDRSNS